MELKIRKNYAADGEGSSGGTGAGSVEKYFDYDLVDEALTSLQANIAAISEALSKKINVTSYSGDAQAEVEGAVDSIRTYLATMEEPLTKMKNKINEVRKTYAKSEADIKASLTGIKAGSFTGISGN